MAVCNTCFGTGKVGSGYENCSGCGGSGQAGGGTCPYCGGSGTSSIPREQTCYACNGKGSFDDPPFSNNIVTNVSKQKFKNTGQAGKPDEGFSPVMALIAFAVIGFVAYKPENENLLGALVVGGIGGVLAGRYFKLIIAIVIIITLILTFSD